MSKLVSLQNAYTVFTLALRESKSLENYVLQTFRLSKWYIYIPQTWTFDK